MSKPLDAYHQVADEFGVTVPDVRVICGAIGLTGSQMSFEQWLGFLRGKMDAAGLVPTSRDVHNTREKPVETEEMAELRSCTLCEQFLEEDDEGTPLHHSETSEDGVLCRNCAERSEGFGS